MDLTKMTRKDVIPLYVDLIKKGVGSSPEIINFNMNIINRWSNSALIYIKEEAWKIIKKS